MANFTENNLLYHIFSKSPVSDATTLAQSLNKSGHTLTTDDIFGEELPAFYDVANTDERDSLTVAVNDVCKIGKNFYYYGLNPLKEDGSYEWLERSAIVDGECLFNRSSEYTNNGTDWKNHPEVAVVKYHENKDGEFITEGNNGVNGNKFTVRVKKTDGNYIKQFISVTDKIVNSRTSNGYTPLVLQNGSVMEENAKYKDASSDNMRYVANCYAGIIQFPVQKSGTTVASNIKISVWEYIGKTLTDVLKGFATVDSGFNYKVADSYPTASAELKGWVYLIPSTTAKDSNVHDEYICVEDDKGGWKWEQIGSTAITLPKAGDYLELENNAYNVKYSTTIIDDNHATVPTTKAVFDLFNANKEKVSPDKIFDLNAFIVNHIKTHPNDTTDWVREVVKSDTTYIPHRSSFYGKNVSMADAKEKWLVEAKTGEVSVQLVFPYDSYLTNLIIRKMFWQLDEDAVKLNPNSPKYGQEGSISKTFMKPGLTIKYFTFLDDGNWHDYNDYDYDTKFEEIDNDIDAKTFYPSYTFQTWIGNSKFSKDRSDTLIKWKNNDGSAALNATDAFMRAYNWTFTANEQQVKQIKEAIIANTIEIENSKLRITQNNWVKFNHGLYTTSGYGDAIEAAYITREYFTTGEVNAIEIPYDSVNSSQWSNNTPIYLVVSVFDSNGTKKTQFVSYNTQTYNTNNSSYKFTFNNCIIPEEYAYVILSASSQNTSSDSQQFRVIALRSSNSKEARISIPNCKFTSGTWTGDGRVPAIIFNEGITYISNEVQTDITEDVPEDSYSVGTTKAIKDYIKQAIPEAGDYLSFDEENNAYNVDISESIEDDANTVPTTKAVYEYVRDTINTNDSGVRAGHLIEVTDGNVVAVSSTDTVIPDYSVVPTSAAVYDALHDPMLHQKWHDDNGLKHVELYDFNYISVFHNNLSTGVRANGFTLILPHLTKLTKIRVYGYYSAFGLPPSGGNSDFEMYLKLIDKKSGHILAVSNKAEKQDSGVGTAVFRFNEDNQILIPKNTEIKAIFSSNNNFYDTTNDKSFLIAFADSAHNKKLFTEKINDEVITYLSGQFTPKYIDTNGNEQSAPEQFIQRGMDGSSNTINCIGMAVVPYGTFNRTVEFNDVVVEALKIYQHANEPSLEVSDHIKNTDIHFSKSDITDFYFGEEKTWDFSLGYDPKGAQGIAYAQICADHVLPENSYVSKITVPQHPSPSTNEYTANTPLYLVIYGDTTGLDNWVFVAHSTNTDMQVGGGNPMVFEFEKGIDIGLYKKYRFFYVTDVSTTPQLPTTGTGFNGVKMAFPARNIDNNCQVMQTNGTWAKPYTYPAIISYSNLESTLHIENDERHITKEDKERWNAAADRIAELEATIATLTTQLTQLTAQN